VRTVQVWIFAELLVDAAPAGLAGHIGTGAIIMSTHGWQEGRSASNGQRDVRVRPVCWATLGFQWQQVDWGKGKDGSRIRPSVWAGHSSMCTESAGTDGRRDDCARHPAR